MTLAPLLETFNPGEARDPSGKWVNGIVKDLKAHGHVRLPDGIAIRREAGGHSVRSRAGREHSFHTAATGDSAKSAVRRALDLSAQSRHPDSVGGAHSYRSLAEFKKMSAAGRAKAKRAYVWTVPGVVRGGRVVTGGPANSVRAKHLKGQMSESTVAPLLSEAADSMAKASTPEPFSRSRTSNWVARAGGLPDYVQHIAHDLVEKRGKSESEAIQMAIGIVKRWARGGGNVDAGTRAAAAKAVAEWERMKGANKAKGALQHSWVEEADRYVPSWADERTIVDAALLRVAVLEQVMGVDGMLALLAEPLSEAAGAAWQPTLKRVASAPDELERHEVYDGSQHCGTVSCRNGMDASRPRRWSAFAINGRRVTDYNTASKPDALSALQSHLEEAPARVLSFPTAGKFLVAEPSAYSGDTTYRSYSSEPAARHAAGLPPTPTVPEINSKVTGLAESLVWDLDIVAARDIPPLRRVQEARRAVPLAEAFSASELRDFRGRWRGSGARKVERATRGLSTGSHTARLTPSSLPGRSTLKRSGPRVAAEIRYEGGGRRASAKLREAHARKPQIATATEKKPEEKLAAAVRPGVWDRGAADASRRLIAQPQMQMDEIERKVKAGEALDTEKAHRTGPGGTYSRERQALHEHIIDLLLQGKGVHEGKARAIFTAGGGASGKSAMVASGAIDVPHDAVIANPDVVREMLPEYKALKAAGREDAASLTHEEASHITKLVTRIALGRQHHVLVDGTGNSGAGKFAGKIAKAQAAGHRVSVHYATVPTEEAIRRSDIRGQETRRFVDHSVLRQAHKSVSANFPDVLKIPGVHVQVFSTAGPASQPPELLAERKAGHDKLVIGNRGEFKGFLHKANE